MRKACLAPALLLLMTGAASAQPAPALAGSSSAAEKDKGGGVQNNVGGAPQKNAPQNNSSDAAPKSTGAAPHQASNKTSSGRGLSADDKKFLSYVAKVNQDEIQLCRYAAEKAQSPAIKAFARLMVNDHSAVGKQISSLVNENHAGGHAHHIGAHARSHASHIIHHAKAAPHAPGVKAPSGGHEEEDVISKLKGKSGADFDNAFMAEQVDYHSGNVGKFDDEIKNSGNDRVRRFASETQDAFKGHLQMAKAVKDSSGKP